MTIWTTIICFSDEKTQFDYSVDYSKGSMYIDTLEDDFYKTTRLNETETRYRCYQIASFPPLLANCKTAKVQSLLYYYDVVKTKVMLVRRCQKHSGESRLIFVLWYIVHY